ncbi:MAG: Tim44 domain-containing protein, partial [Burkholderiales bacterium]
MKSLILALSMAVLCAGLAPTDADARRLGGGGSAGMQRSVPARTPPAAAPAQTAQPAQAAAAVPATAAAAAAAPKRSWMGPIAGLAAGLGIAALMSHFGMGAELGNIVTMVLFALLAVFAIRFLMRRFMPGATPAMATPNAMPFNAAAPVAAPGSPNWVAPAATAAAASALPAGFDAPAFERIAKMIFIRMQA